MKARPKSKITTNKQMADDSAEGGGGGSSADAVEDLYLKYFSDQITAIYRVHNPSKLDSIPALLTKHSARLPQLLEAIEKKYGVQHTMNVGDMGEAAEEDGGAEESKGAATGEDDDEAGGGAGMCSLRTKVGADEDEEEEEEEEDGRGRSLAQYSRAYGSAAGRRWAAHPAGHRTLSGNWDAGTILQIWSVQ